MSNIGLNSNLYYSARRYLELLNDFLIQINYAQERGEPYSNPDIINFFEQLSNKAVVDLEFQLLRSYFNRFYKQKGKDMDKELAKITDGLKQSTIKANTLSEVTDLVNVLKYQCSQSFSRMRGNKEL